MTHTLLLLKQRTGQASPLLKSTERTCKEKTAVAALERLFALPVPNSSKVMQGRKNG